MNLLDIKISNKVFLSGLISMIFFCASFGYRVYDAMLHGDWTLALITDSFMGFPITHILSMIALGFCLLCAILFFYDCKHEVSSQ